MKVNTCQTAHSALDHSSCSLNVGITDAAYDAPVSARTSSHDLAVDRPRRATIESSLIHAVDVLSSWNAARQMSFRWHFIEQIVQGCWE